MQDFASKPPNLISHTYDHLVRDDFLRTCTELAAGMSASGAKRTLDWPDRMTAFDGGLNGSTQHRRQISLLVI